MSRLYDTVEPSVISEDMLQLAVEEQGPKDEMGKIAKHEGIDFAEVKSLRLDYKNILRIDNLWCFRSLVKLQLDNNIIEKIEGLDVLVNLVWLDLSFNNIEVIEGLNKLTKLEDVTLFNNRIQSIENMDTLVELHVFSVGNNELKELENIIYLRRFKKLQALTLAGNPICQLEEYKPFVFAYLPCLEYLDYRLVDDAVRASACERYETALQEIQVDEKLAQTKAEELAVKQKEFILHKEAFVENLNGSDLFDSMYADDAEGKKLNKLPGVDEMLLSFKERFTSICRQIFEYGLQSHAEREQELTMFFDAIETAKKANKQQASVKIDEFLTYKQQIWQKLTETTDQSTADVLITEYHQNVNELWDTLMNFEMQLVEQLEDAIKEFERNMSDLVSTFTENIQALITQCRELENQHHERLLELSVNVLDKVIKSELDDEIADELNELLVDKDTIVNAVSTSHDAHLLKIDNREDDITSHIRQWLTSVIDDAHDREEVKRNRARVT
jgi:hypothetical protein